MSLDEWLQQIAGRSATLEERLRGRWWDGEVAQFTSASGKAGGQAHAEQRMARWSQRIACPTPAQFTRRLAWDGLHNESLLEQLEQLGGGPTVVAPLPPWTTTLTQMVAAVLSQRSSVASRETEGEFLVANAPVPFQELLSPMVHLAQARLDERSGALGVQLLAPARADAARTLLTGLARILGRSLWTHFERFRQHQGQQEESGAGATLYDKFLCARADDGLFSFFGEFPVAARLAAVCLDHWVDAQHEFLARLHADRVALEEHWSIQGRVASLSMGLSDAHAGGRSVIRLFFECGTSILYKPKDMQLEGDYQSLLAWLNLQHHQHNDLPDFYIVQLIVRQGYGWSAFVTHQPCQNSADVTAYYTRAGALAAVVYLLFGADCHFENIIAHGAWPVLIDAEALLHQVMREVAVSGNDLDLDESVLGTGLFPCWSGASETASYDIGGFTGSGGQKVVDQAPTWVAINTDAMRLEYVPLNTAPTRNLPYLDGNPAFAVNHVETITAGFAACCRFLRSQASTLLAVDGPLGRLAQGRTRFVFRPTRVYSFLQHHLLAPEYLRDGLDWGIELDGLARAVAGTNEQTAPFNWPFLAHEKAALVRGDVPVFFSAANSTDVFSTAGLVLKDCFAQTCWQRVQARLAQLDEDDITRQTGFIRAALLLSAASTHVEHMGDVRVQAPMQPVMAIPSSQVFLDLALRLGEEIERRAIPGRDAVHGGRRLGWLSVEYHAGTQQKRLEPMGHGLYSGLAGVGLFYAALARCSGEHHFGAVARQLFAQIRQDMERGAVLPSGGFGLGGLLYALVRAGQFLDAPELMAQGQKLAQVFPASLISNDRVFDVHGGVAGLLLGLLAICTATGGAGGGTALDRAIACGRHLVEHRSGLAGQRTWAADGSPALTGFAHGAAGIALALKRLYALAPEPYFKDAADEALDWEHRFYSAQEQNWADLRLASSVPQYRLGWCNGAPGIALARLAALSVDPTSSGSERDLTDIQAGLQTTMAAGLRDVDNLCCGNFGRIDILLAGRTVLAQAGDVAYAQAAALVGDGTKYASDFRLVSSLPRGIFSPGLFQGAAGIGYVLLRLASPSTIPCVLALQ